MQRNLRTPTQPSTGYVRAALDAFFAGQPRQITKEIDGTTPAATPAPLRSVGSTMQFAGNGTKRETREQREAAMSAGSIAPPDMDFILGRNGKGHGNGK